MEDSRSMRFPADTAQLAEIRDFATRAAGELGADVEVEVLKVVVGELAANAVVHQSGDALLCLEATTGGGLLVSVIDEDPNVPSTYDGEPWDIEGHRGMLLVEALSDRWGVEPMGAGKRVWARLGTRPGHE